MSGVTPDEEGAARKVKVKVRESIHGTFFLKSASMVEKIKEEEEEAMETDGGKTGGRGRGVVWRVGAGGSSPKWISKIAAHWLVS